MPALTLDGRGGYGSPLGGGRGGLRGTCVMAGWRKQCVIGLWKEQMRVSRKKHGRDS